MPDYLARHRAPTSRYDQAVPEDPARRRRVGNIYASEACFARGASEACGGAGEWRAARRARRGVSERMGDAIRAGGDDPLRDTWGPTVRRVLPARLYVYDGPASPAALSDPCAALVQGQRSTYYCPRCQRFAADARRLCETTTCHDVTFSLPAP